LIVTRYSLTLGDLAGFNGSDVHYVHPLFRFRYTEGVRHVATHGGAWWLLDAIASWQPKLKKRRDLGFQVWTLRRTPDKGRDSADLGCTDGNKNHVLTQHVEYTDFPLDEIKLYWIDGVLLLPSEY
jgi:hypothetical protein